MLPQLPDKQAKANIDMMLTDDSKKSDSQVAAMNQGTSTPTPDMDTPESLENEPVVSPRRQLSFTKRRGSFSKKRKFLEMEDELMQARYSLYFADDVVQTGIQVKSELRYMKLMGETENQYLRDLREQEGIYFQFDVTPSSPTKDEEESNFLLLPFEKDPYKAKSEYSNMSSRQKLSPPKLHSEGDDFEREPEETVSPTFAPQGEDNSRSKSSCGEIQGKTRVLKKGNTTALENMHSKQSAAKLSAGGLTVIESDGLAPNSNDSPFLHAVAAPASIQNQTQLQSPVEYQAADSELLDKANNQERMRKISSNLVANYQAPNVQQIKKELRLQEIAQIDEKVKVKSPVSKSKVQDISLGKPKLNMYDKEQFAKNHPFFQRGKTLAQDSQGFKIIPEEARQSSDSSDSPIESKHEEGDLILRGPQFHKPSKILVFAESKESGNISKRSNQDDDETPQNFLGSDNSVSDLGDGLDIGEIMEEPKSSNMPKTKKSALDISKVFRYNSKRIDMSQARANEAVLKSDNGRGTSNCSANSNLSESGSDSSEKESSEDLRIYRLQSVVSRKKCVGERHIERRLKIQVKTCDRENDPLLEDIRNARADAKKSTNTVMKGLVSKCKSFFNFEHQTFGTKKNNLMTMNRKKSDAQNLFSHKRLQESAEPVSALPMIRSGTQNRLDSSDQASSNRNQSTVKKVNSSTKSWGNNRVAEQFTGESMIPQIHDSVPVKKRPSMTQSEKRRRKREIKQLKKSKPKPSKEQEEESRIIKLQVYGLKMLKREAERILGRKVKGFEGQGIPEAEVENTRNESEITPQDDMTPKETELESTQWNKYQETANFGNAIVFQQSIDDASASNSLKDSGGFKFLRPPNVIEMQSSQQRSSVAYPKDLKFKLLESSEDVRQQLSSGANSLQARIADQNLLRPLKSEELFEKGLTTVKPAKHVMTTTPSKASKGSGADHEFNERGSSSNDPNAKSAQQSLSIRGCNNRFELDVTPIDFSKQRSKTCRSEEEKLSSDQKMRSQASSKEPHQILKRTSSDRVGKAQTPEERKSFEKADPNVDKFAQLFNITQNESQEQPCSPFLPFERMRQDIGVGLGQAQPVQQIQMPMVDLIQKKTEQTSTFSDKMDVESSKKSSKKQRGPSPPRRYLMPLLELEREQQEPHQSDVRDITGPISGDELPDTLLDESFNRHSTVLEDNRRAIQSQKPTNKSLSNTTGALISIHSKDYNNRSSRNVFGSDKNLADKYQKNYQNQSLGGHASTSNYEIEERTDRLSESESDSLRMSRHQMMPSVKLMSGSSEFSFRKRSPKHSKNLLDTSLNKIETYSFEKISSPKNPLTEGAKSSNSSSVKGKRATQEGLGIQLNLKLCEQARDSTLIAREQIYPGTSDQKSRTDEISSINKSPSLSRLDSVESKKNNLYSSKDKIFEREPSNGQPSRKETVISDHSSIQQFSPPRDNPTHHERQNRVSMGGPMFGNVARPILEPALRMTKERSEKPINLRMSNLQSTTIKNKLNKPETIKRRVQAFGMIEDDLSKMASMMSKHYKKRMKKSKKQPIVIPEENESIFSRTDMSQSMFGESIKSTSKRKQSPPQFAISPPKESLQFTPQTSYVGSQYTANPRLRNQTSVKSRRQDLTIQKKVSELSSFSQSRQLGFTNYFENTYCKDFAQSLPKMAFKRPILSPPKMTNQNKQLTQVIGTNKFVKGHSNNSGSENMSFKVRGRPSKESAFPEAFMRSGHFGVMQAKQDSDIERDDNPFQQSDGSKLREILKKPRAEVYFEEDKRYSILSETMQFKPNAFGNSIKSANANPFMKQEISVGKSADSGGTGQFENDQNSPGLRLAPMESEPLHQQNFRKLA